MLIEGVLPTTGSKPQEFLNFKKIRTVEMHHLIFILRIISHHHLGRCIPCPQYAPNPFHVL